MNSNFIKMTNCFGEDCWQKAFCYIENLFGIEALFLDQKEAIKAFIEKYTNVCVSLQTGAGKSLIFQSLPIIYDELHGDSRGTSVLMVIPPLKALMKDQVRYLGNFGIPAVAVTDERILDPEILQVKNGTYTLVYGSPECFLSLKA